jgi:hypothetical protein
VWMHPTISAFSIFDHVLNQHSVDRDSMDQHRKFLYFTAATISSTPVCLILSWIQYSADQDSVDQRQKFLFKTPTQVQECVLLVACYSHILSKAWHPCMCKIFLGHGDLERMEKRINPFGDRQWSTGIRIC